MTDFDMPPTGATFEQRGGWLAKALATDFGLPLSQAAGIVGNLGFESGGFKELQEISPRDGGEGGLGWAQWTGPRRRDFVAWCGKWKLSPTSDEGNYRYLVYDLQGVYASSIIALKKTPTVDAAVFSFGQTYERPYGTTPGHLPGYAERLAWAKRAVAGVNATGVIPGPVMPDTDRVPQPQPPSPAPYPARPYAMPAAEDSDAEAERLNQAELDKNA